MILVSLSISRVIKEFGIHILFLSHFILDLCAHVVPQHFEFVVIA